MTIDPIAIPDDVPPEVSDPPEQVVYATGLVQGFLIRAGVTIVPRVDVNDKGDMVTSRFDIVIAPELLVTVQVLGATNG